MRLTSYTSTSNSLRPLFRSLLQKAVRRGYGELSRKIAFLLAEQGDSAWLRSRIGIIIFEECWPYARMLGTSTPPAVLLSSTANAVKNKNAAGLGSLALAAGQGDASVIELVQDSRAVKIVAAALNRPESFFKWAMGECASAEQLAIVLAAQRHFGKASWPWDKAFMAAGAYLSIVEGVPIVDSVGGSPKRQFPYWVAVDKHTPQGKLALRQVAAKLHIEDSHLQWVSFYFESAKINEQQASPWWAVEAKWRLEGLGLDLVSAEDLWKKASPLVEVAVKKYADIIHEVVEKVDADELF